MCHTVWSKLSQSNAEYGPDLEGHVQVQKTVQRLRGAPDIVQEELAAP